MRWSDLAAYGVVFCLSLTYFAVTSDSSRSSVTPRTNHAVAKNTATAPQNSVTAASTGNVPAKQPQSKTLPGTYQIPTHCLTMRGGELCAMAAILLPRPMRIWVRK